MSKNTTLHSVGLLSRPMSSASISPFLNLICIIRDIYPDAHVITVHDANSHIDGYFHKIKKTNFSEIVHYSGRNNIFRIFHYFITQTSISKIIMEGSKPCIWIFFIDNGYILPMLINWMLGNKTIVIIGGNQR